MKKFILSCFLSIGLLLFAAVPPVCHASKDAQTIHVEVVRPRVKDMTRFTEITGTVVSPDVSSFGARTPGIVNDLLADEGDSVQKGQILARLDATDYQLALKLAKLQMEAATSQVAQAETGVKKESTHLETMQKDLARIRDVVAKGSLPGQKLDHAINDHQAAVSGSVRAGLALAAARTRVELARTQVAMAKKKVADCEIRAPFDGVVTKRHANLGEWAAPGMPLFTVQAMDPVEVKGALSEIYMDQVRKGMPVLIFLDGAKDLIHGGETLVTEIAPLADPLRRTIVITVNMPNPGHRIKPGMFARMQVVFEKVPDALSIPVACLLTQYETPHVFVVEDETARAVEIRTGITQGEHIQVLSGLKPESLVVTLGKNQLAGGEKIAIGNQEAP